MRYRYREIQEDKGGDIEIQVWRYIGRDSEIKLWEKNREI